MRPAYYSLLFLSIFMIACGTNNVFERTERFASHEWMVSQEPLMKFEIADTSSFYNIYVVIRHTDAYRYNNIWLNITTQSPNDTPRTQLLDISLADNTKGWLGSGMDDIFDRRARITQAPIRLKKGTYTFKLQQAMREDPLGYVLSAGIRVEKVQP
ncbi:gliding motility lipoprotein GldH [Sediminibacterium sp.]|uniref:gliding motility lipoprotein GldH n=1 Tax=Sediminibacterium sp. TaxID=1917865 RepID=UPI0025F5A175|nr:gliding motility lipoprotein GldH [Sediminibacterium sp.]MBW0178933.1 gliding motility lipoprotein GldH [Sediminibacterium sp.]